MVDRLAVLLEQFAVTARVFHTGALCGIHDLAERDGVGHLHLLRRGPLQVVQGDATVQVDTPSLLLYPRPLAHRFVTDPQDGADLACAELRFDGGALNPIGAALPAFVCLPLASIDGAAPVLDLLFEEAFDQRCGRVALVNRLFEVVMIQVLRRLMESGEVRVGMLAGLNHPRLRHALVAIHEAPAHAWSLQDLAARAGLSRTVFASRFREVVGTTPGQYLQGWRVGLAQQALRRGHPLKMVAGEVGYGSEAALSRAFKAHAGLPPRQWRNANQPATDHADLVR